MLPCNEKQNWKDAETYFSAITCLFSKHFEVLQTVLFEVELIIINAALTYVLPKYYRNMFNIQLFVI